MRLFASALDFIVRHRIALAISFGVATLFIYRYQAELDPLPADAIDVRDVEARAVGTLEIHVLGRRDSVTVAQRDAGFGMAFTQRQNPSSLDPLHMLFASELALTGAEIRWIRGHGPLYRIGVVRDEIVTVESPTQTLIGYKRYSVRAAAKRDRWRAIGALVFALGIVLYAFGHWRQAKTEA